MFKWYAVFLLSSTISGWFAYPYTYPVIKETIARGEIPKIDWNQLKPGSLSATGPGASELDGPGTILSFRNLLPADERFHAVVIIAGDARTATGCIIEMKGKPYIVTSQHALAGNHKLTIQDGRGREFRGTKMLAAKTADVALIEIDSPPADLAVMEVAQDAAKVANIGDEIMLAGDAQGTGTIKVSTGKLLALASVFFEVKVAGFSRFRGGPLFHPASGTMLGVLAEATEKSLGVNRGTRMRDIDGGEAEGAIRFLGHRLDTVSEWAVLNWSDFQAASEAATMARRELKMVAAFVDGSAGYGELDELKTAVDRAQMKLANLTLSQADREKTLAELLRTAHSITDRRLHQLRNARRYYIHEQDLIELTKLASEIKAGITAAEKEGNEFGLRHGFRL